jgi:Glycosyltransferase family 87
VRPAVALLAAAAVAIGLIPRVLLASGTLPDALRPFVWSDPLFVYLRGLSGHRLPYVDGPFEYPPVVGLISALFSALSPGPVAFVALWGCVAVLCAAVVAGLLAGAGEPERTRSFFALAPQLLLLGSVNFDLLAVALLVAALVAARSHRDDRTALGLGLGTASKLFPLAATPVAVLRAARPLRSAALIGAVLAACYVPAALAGRSASAGPLFYLVGIDANFDSPWGLVARLLGAAGIPNPQSLVTGITLVGLAVTFVVAVLPRARAADPVVAFGLAIVATLLWSRLYSPQYSLWVLPFFVLLPIGARAFALLTAGDLLVFFSVSPLTLVPWRADDQLPVVLIGMLVLGVSLRLVALLACWRRLRELSATNAATA